MGHIFLGNIGHCISKFTTEFIENGYIIVIGNAIAAVGRECDLEAKKIELNLQNCPVTTLNRFQLLLPGFIDCHIHASQFPNAGVGYDMELLDWLSAYTFPLEARYSDVEFAKTVYKSVVRKTLANGTTTACYFGTIHVDSTIELANAAIELGQRALIGKVNMTQNCPDNLRENSQEYLKDTERFINEVLNKHSQLVLPIITPRFAISCDLDTLKGLGKLANKYNLHIQTHISENVDEVETVEKMFGMKYAEVYDEAKLLTKKTVLAHAIHLHDSETRLLAVRGTSVSHCPSSNFYLQSGVCNVKKLSDAGINVGLGTDVSGGPSPSIVDAMRHAIITSVCKKYDKVNSSALKIDEVFYLATLGGAKALDLEDKIGNFKCGKDFDAVIIDMSSDTLELKEYIQFTPQEIFQKFVYTGDDKNICKVYVSGKQVK